MWESFLAEMKCGENPCKADSVRKNEKIIWSSDFLPKMKNGSLTGDVTLVYEHNFNIHTLDAKISNNCIY